MFDWLRGSKEETNSDAQSYRGSIDVLYQDVKKVISEVTEISDNLLPDYAVEALLYLSQRFEQLSKKFLDYTIVSDNLFYEVIHRSSSRLTAVKKVSQQAK